MSALHHHAYDDQVVIPALMRQMNLFDFGSATTRVETGRYFSAPEIDIDSYDKLILASSGGKDSVACLLHLFDLGVDASKIELWHHDIDGREGSTLMDWIFMRDYVLQFGAAYDLPVYFSWLQNGFEGEMLKENSISAPHMVETPQGLLTLERDPVRSKPATRLRFPQLSASLQTRWCSSALKIDVGRRALNNQDRFDGKKVLFITGERRQESANRAKYHQLEPHSCDRRAGRKARHVDAWRPVLDWSEEQVWDAFERHGVIAPVPYRLGWSRSSCMTCIYNGPRIWATIAHYFPERAKAIAEYEDRFGTTISRDKINVLEVAKRARPFEVSDMEALRQASSEDYELPIFLGQGEKWVMPAGAFGSEGCGSD